MIINLFDCKVQNCGRKFKTEEEFNTHMEKRHPSTTTKATTKELLKPIVMKKNVEVPRTPTIYSETDTNNVSTSGIDDTFAKTTSSFSSSLSFNREVKEINVITKELLGIGTKYEFEDCVKEVKINITL